METGQEKLIREARSRTQKTAAKADALDIDQNGVIKLSGMLETMAGNGMELDSAVELELRVAVDGVGTKLEKVANVKDAQKQLLTKTAEVLRILKAQNNYLVDELASAMQKESVSKFARELVERGICSEKELTEMVEKMTKVGNLDAVRQALDIVQPKKGLPIGAVEKQGAVATVSSGGKRDIMEDPAVQFLMENPA